MTARARRRKETLRHWLNFATGLLIGIVIWTPVLAAPQFMPSQLMPPGWTTLLLVASIVLLGIAVLLRLRARDRTPSPQAQDPENSIGRYRPHIYRP